MAKAPLKDMSMERVRVEEFENQRYKIMDESILLFSRVYFSKILSENSLHFVGIRVFIVGYVRECEKSFFCKTGGYIDSLATGTSREFQLPNN